jgi:SAM-dependent methyltransferase
MNSPNSAADLQQLYRARFEGRFDYRQKVWAVLSQFFSRWIAPESAVLDLGCGWCEFINAVKCGRKFGMDLNPDAKRFANADVRILEQDCSTRWELDQESLDAVFTSNFLEHLPTKLGAEKALLEAHRTIKPGGHFICDGAEYPVCFFDHHVPLTELSLSEILQKCGFDVEFCRARFLPYTMSRGRQYPVWMLRAYLSCPFLWRIAGKQFLVVARKRAPSRHEPALL